MRLLSLLVIALGACDNGSTSPDGSVVSGGAVYTACARIGGVDRIQITKSDAARNLCARIVLVSPAGSPAFGISLPPNWDVESATLMDRATCSGGSSIAAQSGTGAITWSAPGGAYPTRLDIHASLTFPPGTSWAPASERLDADGVPVASSCP